MHISVRCSRPERKERQNMKKVKLSQKRPKAEVESGNKNQNVISTFHSISSFQLSFQLFTQTSHSNPFFISSVSDVRPTTIKLRSKVLDRR